MKNKGLWLVLICMLIFVGCGKKDYPAAIMVNDVLYYSTGEAFSGEVDKSAISGNITSYTDEIPTKNGEANFNRDLDSEYAFTDEGLVVCIENEWILFEQQEPSEGLSDEKGQVYFNATVLELNEDSVKVQCTDAFDSGISVNEEFSVSTDVVATKGAPEMVIGDNIRVVFNGEIMESDPLQLGTVFSIYLLDEHGKVIPNA